MSADHSQNLPRTEDKQDPDLSQLIEKAIDRRKFMSTAGATGMASFLGIGASGIGEARAGLKIESAIGFDPVPSSTIDEVIVPKGYQADILISWGDPIFPNAPEFDPDNTAEDQQQQFGDCNDGMTFFQIEDDRAVLAVNNEYTLYPYLLHSLNKEHDDELWNHLKAEHVEKAKAALGISIVELRKRNGQWVINRDGKRNRRITADTEMRIGGPAAGHPLMKTKLDASGKKAWGTINNCANGRTPWGTYLTCEENFHLFFGAKKNEATPEEKVAKGYADYGISAEKDYKYKWHLHDDRFDLNVHPHEPHRFGWVVEIDPMNPDSIPTKRTALGRIKHENAELVVNEADRRVVVYMGDDEKGEHIYKFVSDGTYDPNDPDNNRDLLENGKLYVAKFQDAKVGSEEKIQGKGKWIPLDPSHPKLKDWTEAEIMIFARTAAKAVGATTMDRPEWVAAHPDGKGVYCTLTNNDKREAEEVNGPNPRADNIYGQIVKWIPRKGNHVSEDFDWEIFLLAGNPAVYPNQGKPGKRDYLRSGSPEITVDNMFNSPDGLGFDQERLWILTDGKVSNVGVYKGMGNNQMLCCDTSKSPAEVKRFLTGPIGCEMTGITFSPDYRTMFVCVQHPGEDGWSRDAKLKNKSTFPGTDSCPIPRSSVIRITRKDGGIIGA